MGCLLEFLFEVLIEGLLELIGYCYLKLMQLIVPQKTISQRAKTTVKTIVTTVAVLLAVVLVVGLILLLQPEPFTKHIGRCMVYASLVVIVLQIVLGILVSIISYFKK